MKLQNKKGFTLIELLVVITIIGILATWATATYTSQIQKARDTTRINDIKAIQWAIEQVYQDRSEYPPSSTYFIKDESTSDAWVSVWTYLQKIPKDPKNWQTCNKGTDTEIPTCVYTYIVDNDDNGIEKWAYVLSTSFESEWKVTTDATKDWWQIAVRWEVWNWLSLSTPLDIWKTVYEQANLSKFKSGSWILNESWDALSSNSWSDQWSTITINWN